MNGFLLVGAGGALGAMGRYGMGLEYLLQEPGSVAFHWPQSA